MALALVVGNMIGSGVYLLPATLAPLGMNALAGWAVTIIGAMALAWVFARLSAKIPKAGGPYAYVAAAFGPGAGFAVAWSYWVSVWTGNAAIAVAAISALSSPLVFLRQPALAAGAALVLVWALVWVNVRGVALAGHVQVVTAIAKLVPLALVMLLGAWYLLPAAHVTAIAPLAVPLSGGLIAQAAALTFWGFLGVEAATVPADKVIDPERTVPRATMLGTAFTGVVYFSIAATLLYFVPSQTLAQSPAPIADFLGRSFGPLAAGGMALFAAVSALGTLNGMTLLQGEMPLAMARGKVFPAWFAHETPQGTPARAHVLSGILLSVVMLLNYSGSTASLFAAVMEISLAAAMLAYFASALAALKLVRGERTVVVAAAVAAGYVAWMVWGLGLRADAWGLALLAAGVPIYWSMRGAARTKVMQGAGG
ncbi:amino acid permease [Novosphingobium sp.]|uniref:amino acid permease n=1 Tax=Novosphingobium sp. TaxID=1874826 RepID=UPI00333EA264